MKIQFLAFSLLLGAPIAGQTAASSAPVPVAPAAAPAPFSPAQPAPARSPGATVAPVAPGQAPVVVPQPNAPLFVGTNGVMPVPRRGAETNMFAAPNRNPGATNGSAPQFANTNSSAYSNVFGGYTNQFGGLSNRFAGSTNQFGGSNFTGFPYSNHLGTNLLVEDEGLTLQDRALLARIRMELLPEIRRDRAPIHLIGQNGVVTLTGLVPSAEESAEFASIVQRTPGVSSVVNHLQVAPWLSAGEERFEDQAFSGHDRELLESVRGRMRHRDREHGASESVHIIARNGVIILAGFVGSQAEEQGLVAAAQSTPGVVRVDNDLQVRSEPMPQPGIGGANSPSGGFTGTESSGGTAAPFVPISPTGSFTNTNTNSFRR